MRHYSGWLIGLILMFANTAMSTISVPLRGWCITHDDLPYLRRVIERAPEFNINMLQLAGEPERGGIVNHLNDILKNATRQEKINTLIKLAHSKNIQVFIRLEEIVDIPHQYFNDNLLNFDNPHLWKWLKARYDSLFTRLPELTGVVLSFEKSQVPLVRAASVQSELTPPERLATLINAIYQICKSHQRILYVQDFSWRWSTVQAFQQALEWVPAEVHVLTKVTVFDFIQTYPQHPLIGQVKPHPQVIEFDLCGKYVGQAKIPWCSPDYLKTRWQEVLQDSGIVGGCGHIDWYRNTVFDTPNEINLFAFSTLLDNPNANMNDVWNDWVRKRFGEKAIYRVVPALKRTGPIAPMIFYVLGCYFISATSNIPSLAAALNTGRIEFDATVTAQWDERFKIIGEKLLNLNQTFVDTVMAEKQLALEKIQQSISELKEAKAMEMLQDKDYDYLSHYLSMTMTCARIWNILTRAVFYLRLFQTYLQPVHQQEVHSDVRG